MRKRLVFLCVLLIVILGAAAVAMAGSDNPSQICKANGDFGLSHDTCVNCFAQGLVTGTPSTVCSCKIVQDLGILHDLGFKSLGHCISSGFILGQ